MHFIDTHTHLYDEAFDEDRSDVIQRTIASGVDRWIFPAIDSASFRSQIAVYEQYREHTFMGMGLHPHLLRKTGRKNSSLLWMNSTIIKTDI